MLAEARWLAEQGVRELFLVSENSTSYGKDLGDLRLLETLLPELAAVDGIERVRVSYLQPAETRPGLVTAIASTPGVAPYFDLSFQHASGAGAAPDAPVRRPESFLGLLEQIRAQAPAGRASAPTSSSASPARPRTTSRRCAPSSRRPGSTSIGVFGYSDEDGTEAASYDGKLDEDEIRDRVEHVTRLVEELTAQRAEERIGEEVVVLVESRRGRRGRRPGRAPGPRGRRVDVPRRARRAVGDLVRAAGSSAPTGSTCIARAAADDARPEPQA